MLHLMHEDSSYTNTHRCLSRGGLGQQIVNRLLKVQHGNTGLNTKLA